MTMHILPMGKLYILSGVPGSGKSTLLSQLNLPEGAVISSDNLRRLMYGSKLYFEGNIQHEHLYGWGKPPQPVFDTMKTMCRERLKEGLTTFIDTQASTEADRKDWARIAQSQGMPVEVLLFDVPLAELVQRDNLRAAKVGADVVERCYKTLVRTSSLPFRIIHPGDTASLEAPVLPGDAYDVVGDVHGLFDQLMTLLKNLGYVHNEQGVPVHPDGRKLVFLGDVVDRGRQSLLMLHYVEQASRLGGHVFVPGNHEEKLLRTWDFWIRTNEAKGRSRSSSETFMELMGQPKNVQELLMEFIRHQPGYRIIESNGEQFVCAHADITYFDPLLTPKAGLFYGDSDYGKVDSDARYEEGYTKRTQ